MIGPVGGCAVKLDADEDVEEEDSVSPKNSRLLSPCRRRGGGRSGRPAQRAVFANFPVLGGIGALTIFADHDEAGVAAAIQCKKRWQAAGRGVRIVMPRAVGCDWADEWGVR